MNRIRKSTGSLALTLCLISVGGPGTESLRAADELTPSAILKLLGAKGRNAGTQAELAAYGRHFAEKDFCWRA